MKQIYESTCLSGISERFECIAFLPPSLCSVNLGAYDIYQEHRLQSNAKKLVTINEKIILVQGHSKSLRLIKIDFGSKKCY